MSSVPYSRIFSREGSTLLAAFALAALASCAQVGNPPGGPADKTPPVMLEAEPGSLAVGVAFDQPLRFVFNEKVERRGVTRSVQLIPDVLLRGAEFDGTALVLEPELGWPADTVVVWTLLTTLKDKHGVAMETPRSGAFTTAERMPPGAIVGQARVSDVEADLSTLRANLQLPAPEGSRRRPLWRFDQGQGGGRFSLTLLDVPSGPFFLEAFLDNNGNGQRDEREPVAEVDSLFLAPPDSILMIGVLDLIDLEGPVETWACLAEVPADSLPRIVYFLPVRGENARSSSASVDSAGCVGPQSLVPGPHQVGAWLDLNGDGRFGPDSLGVSEPFLPFVEWEVRPEHPDTLLLAGPPTETLEWAVVDTLRPPPVPRDLFSP